MSLPALFEGVYDALPMYQLATLCRLNYNPTADLWQFVSRGLRRHVQNQELGGGVDSSFPRTNILELADHRIIVIAGSTDLRTWANNVRNMAMAPAYTDPQVMVGVAFWQMAQALTDQLNLSKIDWKKPSVIVGHSLGGALAVCLARLWDAFDTTGQHVTISFGAPRVGTGNFNDLIRGHVCRVIYNADLITHLPQRGVWIDNSNWPYVIRNTPFQHGGDVIWFNARSGQTVRLPESNLSGPDLVSNDLGVPSMFDLTSSLPALVQMAADHKIINYCRSFRADVVDGPRFILEAFDQINQTISAAESETWPELTDILSGVALHKERLPEDPVELLPFPAPAPEFDPTLPPPVLPAVVPPRIIQERALRRRRNI